MKQLIVIGDPIDHSLTPTMYNAAFKHLGLDNRFHCTKLRVKTNDLANFVKDIKNGKIHSANVTIPHKEKIIPHLDQLTDEARTIKAVNVVFRKNGCLIGHNTDCIGLLRSLFGNGTSIKNKKIVILGAGGVAKAAAYALSINFARKIVIINRTISKAENLSDQIKKRKNTNVKARALNALRLELKDADILINCTSVGMKGYLEDESLVPIEFLNPKLIVMDMVYHPLKTKLISDAEKIGAKTIDGSKMLLHQGVVAFELIVGTKAPVETMEKALLGVLKSN